MADEPYDPFGRIINPVRKDRTENHILRRRQVFRKVPITALVVIDKMIIDRKRSGIIIDMSRSVDDGHEFLIFPVFVSPAYT